MRNMSAPIEIREMMVQQDQLYDLIYKAVRSAVEDALDEIDLPAILSDATREGLLEAMEGTVTSALHRLRDN